MRPARDPFQVKWSKWQTRCAKFWGKPSFYAIVSEPSLLRFPAYALPLVPAHVPDLELMDIDPADVNLMDVPFGGHDRSPPPELDVLQQYARVSLQCY